MHDDDRHAKVCIPAITTSADAVGRGDIVGVAVRHAALEAPLATAKLVAFSILRIWMRPLESRFLLRSEQRVEAKRGLIVAQVGLATGGRCG